MTILRMTEEEWNATRGVTTGEPDASRTAAVDAGSSSVVRDRLFDLRDYFAGQALCGALACPELVIGSSSDYAAFAYKHADAMLKERERTKA